ncbi:MAG: tetratricopeptide repeat protein [Reyranella sp.]
MPQINRRRDVFICFSKARPGEAKVAISLKDVLEQHDLFAFEYEDWSWIGGDPGLEADVDRGKLRQMLTTCSVVVLISPHEGEASPGVQTEIAELRACGSPVILLHWSPGGWNPILQPQRFEGLNVIWAYEGRSMPGRDVADNQCEFLAKQLAAGAWLACQVRHLHAKHATTGGALLASLPQASQHALLNFRLQQSDDTAMSDEDVGVAALASDVAGRATPSALRGFLSFWRGGADLMAATVARESRFSLIRPLKAFAAAGEALADSAAERLGSDDVSGATVKERGLMLIRLNRIDEAIATLTRAFDRVPANERFEVWQALAIAYQETDRGRAIDCLTSAIDCAPGPEIASTLCYNRGVMRLEAGQRQPAIDDFSFVIDTEADTALRLSALRVRAKGRAELNDADGAIADFTQLLADADSSPRMAVSAWMDRGALYAARHRAAEAIADWTRAIDAADATPLQRFRSLEARAQALESSGQKLAAAADCEAMAQYTNADSKYREELRRRAAQLRR